MTRAQQWITGAALCLLLGIVLLVYWPGLKGPLILDDIANLGRLKNIGPVDDLFSFLQFIFSSSHAYPIRPLSFASFLINDVNWPLYVPEHKYTNVLIHLLNGALVFWLALLLCRFAKLPSRAIACISLTAAALWLLAPLQVSAVLYVIQRMTELSALFTLCGVIAFCYGRRSLEERPLPAFTLMTAGVVVFGILGFLCKQNAILLTLYILAVEYTLINGWLPIANSRTRAHFTAWKWLVLIAPVVLAFVYIIWHGVFNGYEYRPFTPFERIVSQPRILFDYLQNLLIPARQGMGVAHDDFVLSSGWLSPPTTLISVVVLVAAFVTAIHLSRKSASLFGFAVLWFLAGHVMESSFIALEPYFEHRNYLPAFGPFFVLSYFVWNNRLEVRKYIKIGLVLYVAAFAIVTRQNVDVWTSKAAMAEVWSRDHPRSVRAQQIRADVWSRAGRGRKALEILHNIARLRPTAMAPQLQYLLATCRAAPDDVEAALAETENRLTRAHFDHAVIPTLIDLKDTYEKKCPKLSSDEMLGLVDIVLDQESVSIRLRAVSDLLYVRATILAQKGELQDAVSHLYVAFQKHPSVDLGLASAEYLYNLKQYKEALKVLDDIQQIHYRPWNSDNFRNKEIEKWRRRIQKQIRQ